MSDAKGKPRRGRIRATAAVIERDGLILVGLRMKNDTYGGLWEFPGGKIDPGEDTRTCLARELEEELGITAEIGDVVCVVEPNPGFHLTVHHARIIDGEPRLIEHDELRWVRLDQLDELDMLPADKPVIRTLQASSADPDGGGA
ncbi:MAG: (deoxy)nucleoside triphosphate pyrophosphohydrolase [Planctomycetota bacterium]|nr:(deoxy)nucleoside triphosphate pyrophosphohydrolase [Planctomycetota bacterium]